MPNQAAGADVESQGTAPRSALELLLFAAPWVVFGPITGVMSGLAIRSFRAGRPARAVLWLIANVCTVLSIPLLTATILRHI